MASDDIRRAPIKGRCMSKIRAVRLSPEEEKLVQSFLQKNPLFDFTTLVRAALREFIRRPQVSLTAVDSSNLEFERSSGSTALVASKQPKQTAKTKKSLNTKSYSKEVQP